MIENLVDRRNRRVGKRVDGVLVEGWLYDDQLRVLAELDGQNNVVGRFVYGDGVNVPELMEKGGRTYRLVKDQLGSVRMVVDIADGTIAQELRYDAWGNVMYDSNPGFQPFGFAGGLYDPQTRLVRFGARDYDAQLGRWMSRDPIAFPDLRPCGGSNLYLYACGSAPSDLDPSGLAVNIKCGAGQLKTDVLGWLKAACEYLKSESCQDALRRFGMKDCMADRCRGNCGGKDLVLQCAEYDDKGERNWCAETDWDRCTIIIEYNGTKRGRCGAPGQALFHELIHSCGPMNHRDAFWFIHRKCLGFDPWQRD